MAHLLNSLAKKDSYPTDMKKVIQVAKRFRNCHLPHGYLNEELDTTKPPLPSDVRWNSGLSTLERNTNKTGTSQVGAISKAQKAQNIFFGKKFEIFEKFFLSENVAQCRKM